MDAAILDAGIGFAGGDAAAERIGPCAQIDGDRERGGKGEAGGCSVRSLPQDGAADGADGDRVRRGQWHARQRDGHDVVRCRVVLGGGDASHAGHLGFCVDW